MFAVGFKEKCPECGTEYCFDHDIDTEVINQKTECDECGCKFGVNSRANVDIQSYTTKEAVK